ncbi:hypothetical protein ACTFIZ_012351 [Dictyostelium cf. discoideum]
MIFIYARCDGAPRTNYIVPRESLSHALETIISFEDYLKGDDGVALFESTINNVPGLKDMIFPLSSSTNSNLLQDVGWPKIQDMINSNKRIIMFSDRADKKALGVAYFKDISVENDWNLGILKPNFTVREELLTPTLQLVMQHFTCGIAVNGTDLYIGDNAVLTFFKNTLAYLAFNHQT